MLNLKREEKKDGNEGGGGSGYESETGDNKKPPENSTGSEGKGSDDNLDEFGYAKEPEKSGDEKKAGEGNKESKQDPPANEKKIEPGTGYDADKEPEAPVAEEKKEDPKPPEGEKKEGELELDVKDVPEADVKMIRDLAKAQKFTKEQAQALLEIRKGQLAQAAENEKKALKAIEAERQETRRKWHQELKSDPAFGGEKGEKFASSIKNAEKVWDELFPNSKKELTKRGSVLPPYLMRDLAKAHDLLYSNSKLELGDAPQPDPEKAEEDDGTAFYRT